MKRNILSLIGLTAFFAIGIISLNVISDSGTTSVYAFSGNSPGAKTASPGDGVNCTQCHSGTVNSGSGTRSVTSNIPVSGYVPGQTYTITGTITEALINKFGFEITAEKDADNSKIGTIVLTDATNTQFVNSNNAVTHKSAGTSGTGSRTWSFDWIAPVAGTGDVTFYGAFNAVNNDGSTAGDKVYTTSVGVSEANCSATDTENPVPSVNSLVDSVAVCEITSLTAPTAIDACEGTITGTHNATLPINSNGTTVVTWTYDDGNGNSITQNQNVIITSVDTMITLNGSTLTAVATGASYQWIDCGLDAFIPNETNQIFTPTTNGNYAVEITSGTCIDTSSCHAVVITDLNENYLDDNLQVFPNPTNGKITINTNKLDNNIVTIVYDFFGKEIIKTKEDFIDLISFPNGIYIVKIQLEDTTIVKKIIKE